MINFLQFEKIALQVLFKFRGDSLECDTGFMYPRESAILARFLFALAPLVEVVESNNVPRWKAENIPDILRGVATFSDKKCSQ